MFGPEGRIHHLRRMSAGDHDGVYNASRERQQALFGLHFQASHLSQTITLRSLKSSSYKAEKEDKFRS